MGDLMTRQLLDSAVTAARQVRRATAGVALRCRFRWHAWTTWSASGSKTPHYRKHGRSGELPYRYTQLYVRQCLCCGLPQSKRIEL